MRIIVYGSLRRKQGNSHWMTNAQWLGDHELEGYALYNLGQQFQGKGKSIVKFTASRRLLWLNWTN
jgi:gamma-glutamylcyclotransferase (GGCT)/AIG2-like uncharacterized protein YtfP